MNSLEAVDEFEQELLDRFGPIPEAAANLIYLLRAKTLAGIGGVESIVVDDAHITVRVRDRLTLIEWMPSTDVEAAVTLGRITVSIGLDEGEGWREILEKLLRELSEAKRRA